MPWADYVTFLLTGEKYVTESFAARTLLYDRVKHGWSDEIAEAAAFRLAKLPVVIPSGAVCGKILPETARDLGLSPHAVVVSGIHDQCAVTLEIGVLPHALPDRVKSSNPLLFRNSNLPITPIGRLRH